jgi:hypothetical protein
MHACVHVCMCVCVYVCTCDVYMCVWMHVCMCVRFHTGSSTQTQSHHTDAASLDGSVPAMCTSTLVFACAYTYIRTQTHTKTHIRYTFVHKYTTYTRSQKFPQICNTARTQSYEIAKLVADLQGRLYHEWDARPAELERVSTPSVSSTYVETHASMPSCTQKIMARRQTSRHQVRVGICYCALKRVSNFKPVYLCLYVYSMSISCLYKLFCAKLRCKNQGCLRLIAEQIREHTRITTYFKC